MQSSSIKNCASGAPVLLLRLHLYAKSDAVVNEEVSLIHAVRNLAIARYRRDHSLVVAVRTGARAQRSDTSIAGDLKSRDQTIDRCYGFLAGPQFRRAKCRVVADFGRQESR
jgi:hypothetical protein